MHIIGYAVSAIDVFLEGEKYQKLWGEIDKRVDRVHKELTQNMFELRLTELKTKFMAIKNTYELVINGRDDFDVRKARLDNIFTICEEMYLYITEPTSELYKFAQFCLDLVCCFMVMHLGMLKVAEDIFGLEDYKAKKEYLLKFYPCLMRSYIEKSSQNYIQSIIVNYHNQFAKF